MAELPGDDQRPGIVLFASKEIEPGARAMLLWAEGLFRLDVVLRGDTMRTVVRNLAGGELVLEEGASADTGLSVAVGDVSEYEPGRTALRFALGADADHVEADVVIATLRRTQRGTVQVSAQAIVRGRLAQAPA